MSDDPRREWDVGTSEARRAMMEYALKEEAGNISRAAKRLGIARSMANREGKASGLADWVRGLRVAAGVSETRVRAAAQYPKVLDGRDGVTVQSRLPW